LNKLLSILFLGAVGMALSIAIMIYGWGLEVRSWGWILGGGLAGRLLLAFIEKANKEMP
jgi:hypothetical protein